MRRLIAGIVLLILAGGILFGALYVFSFESSKLPRPTPAPTLIPEVSLHCLVSSETYSFLTSSETQAALDAQRINLKLTVIDTNYMVTQYNYDRLRREDIDCLIPSSNSAHFLFEKTVRLSDFPSYAIKDVFFTPMVVLVNNPYLEALESRGVVAENATGQYTMNLSTVVSQIDNEVRWDTMSSSLSGVVKIAINDPGQSHLASSFLMLAGNIVAGNPYQPYTESDLRQVLPVLRGLKADIGYSPANSQEFFNSWVGGNQIAPMAWVYESQLLERSNLAGWDSLAESFSVVYPEPNLAATHQIMCLYRNCQRLMDVLTTTEFQALAWKYGFRPIAPGVVADPKVFPNTQIPRLGGFSNVSDSPEVILRTLRCLQETGRCS